MTTDKPSVLVTGAAGYIGRLTVKALAARRDALSSLVATDWAATPEERRQEGVVYEQADIRDADLEGLMRSHGIDVVVHLASVVRAPKGAPPDLAYQVDVEGTRRLLEACREVGVRKIVVTSSGAAYGYHPDSPEWLDEADPLRGNDDFEYSRNKRLIEEMLAQWRTEHPELEQLVFRPGTVVGPDARSPVTDLFEMPFMVGILGSPSPFVFIWDEDLVACLVQGALSDKTGIYNQAGDGALTPRELARLLGKTYLPLPAVLVQGVLWITKGLGLGQHGPERVKFLRWRPVLSNRRLKEEFGYTPKHTSREAFERYARARGLLAEA
jgi:UDP-glucose 4-epimerase